MSDQELVVGKTVSKVTQMKKKNYDDQGYILMEFTDGTSCVFIGTYNGYTGESSDEYQTDIHIQSTDKFNFDPNSIEAYDNTTLVPL